MNQEKGFTGFSGEGSDQLLKVLAVAQELAGQGTPMRNAEVDPPPPVQSPAGIEGNPETKQTVEGILEYLESASPQERFAVWQSLTDDLGLETHQVSMQDFVSGGGTIGLAMVALLTALKLLMPGVILFTIPLKLLMGVMLIALGIPALVYRNQPKKIRFLFTMAIGFMVAFILA